MSAAGFLVDQQQAQLAPSSASPYGTGPSQALFDDAAAVHNISMYGDSESSVSYDATAASMQQFSSQLLKTSMPAASTQMQGVGVGAPMQYLSSSSYLPFGGPLPSHLLLQALQAAKPNSRSSNASSATVKVIKRDMCTRWSHASS